MVNLTNLKAEFETDPDALGYASAWAAGDNATLSNLINAPSASYQIDVESLESSEVFEAIIKAEFTALAVEDRELIMSMLGMGTINPKGANTRATFAAVFGAPTTTRANLIALQTRDGSRAESLFGTNVTRSEIAESRLV